ncbi:ADR371Wp [Eremothecium gossypii ATCC 10895]|uniref:ADR371Wp n=1 Tax=Eremothecium gossypii (strain ATCC 10895 / CBS 109.51 / FGSC 9923 / NRRL Y-1056) TaxID=284811 RepID=Q759A6_EREGS|nr:ADR371Wp [Eremothecium gossypii ATCC 10895]AAS52291.1 ADR371Wp [Eremothecium gossypii ATCC 10895]AEY96589.1 FADR371Wp [Eremothecium gossypii FDAG1]
MTSFNFRYEMALAMDQLQPQQLSANVFFGPLNTLSQAEFIESKNIRFFISIGIPIQKVVEHMRAVPHQNYVAAVVDEEHAKVMNENADVALFRKIHTDKIQQLAHAIGGVGHGDGSYPEAQCAYMPAFTTCSAEFKSNVIGSTGLTLMEQFNDLLTLFQGSQLGNVLVYSRNGNDDMMTTLLVSNILRTNAHINLLEAFSYLRSLRPTVSEQAKEECFWNPSLVAYHERIRAEMFWKTGCCSPHNTQSSLATAGAKRRNETAPNEDDIGVHCASVPVGLPMGTGMFPRKRFAANSTADK